MKSLFRQPIFVLFLLSIPVIVSAQAVGVPDLGVLLGILLPALQAKHWGIVVGVVLSLIVYALRTWFLPNWTWAKTDRGGAIVTIGVAIIGTVGAELLANVCSLVTILDAVAAALNAVGFYTLVKKIINPSDTTTKPPPVQGTIS